MKIMPRPKKIALPQEFSYNGLSLAQAIEKRRSERDFSSKTMSLGELSCLLHYAVGITDERYRLRAAPSARALYPIEICPIINRVAGLAPGIYHYSIEDHSLEMVRDGDFSREIVHLCREQEMMGQAGVVIAMTAILERSRRRYQERAYRYTLLEAGHIGQNILLSATSMGLGACAVGAFSDDDINRMLGVDGTKEGVVYLMAVGEL